MKTSRVLSILYTSCITVGTAAAFGFNSYLDTLSNAVPSSSTTSASPASADNSVAHAPLSYFALDQLASKGPRTTADWGTPHEATRKLADDGVLRGGSWWCSEGGWPSPNHKAHTEVFYVCLGHGCLTDTDGVKHYFGPGDTVIIPKGHQGRWDVHQDIHKVWAVNAHDHIEEREHPIRVKVIHYHDYHTNTAAPSGYHENVQSSADHALLYDVGPTKVGIWKSPPTSIRVESTKRIWFLVLKGVVVLSSQDGTIQRCEAGGSVMMPKGWSGSMQIVEPLKKLWVQAE